MFKWFKKKAAPPYLEILCSDIREIRFIAEAIQEYLSGSQDYSFDGRGGVFKGRQIRPKCDFMEKHDRLRQATFDRHFEE